MATRANILEHVLISMLTQDSMASRKSPAAPAFFVAGILGLTGMGFLMIAGYGWLMAHFDQQTAQLYMGGAASSIAVLIAVSAYAVHSYKKRKMRAYYNIVKENLHSALMVVGDELEEPIRENPKTAMLMAGLAGYIAAEKLLH